MSKGLGFPKSIRLRGKADIDTVFRQGQYHRMGWLQAKTRPNRDGDSRFLISVSRRVGSAPVRNRIRRVVREALRLNRHRLIHSNDICLFVTFRPNREVKLGDVERDLNRLFDRLTHLRDASVTHG